MSQVQNNTTLNYIQPLLILSVAYFAGSKRAIQYFPGASQGGLCLAGTLGSLLAYGSQKAVTHKWPGKEESFVLSFARVSTVLACTTLATHFIAKSLKGRIALSLPAAGKFIGVEAALTLLLAGVSHIQTSKPTSPSNPKGSAKPDGKETKTPEKLLQEAHEKYTKGGWETLTPQEQSAWAQKFYAANLPLIPLTSYPEDKESTFDTAPFEKIKDLSELSENQQAWFAAICCFYLIPQRKLDLSAELVAAVKENKRCLQQLSTYFTEHPVAMLKLDGKTTKTALSTALDQNSISQLPKNKDALKTVSQKQLDAFSTEDLKFCHGAVSPKGKNLALYWKGLSKEQKEMFNTTFKENGLKEIPMR